MIKFSQKLVQKQAQNLSLSYGMKLSIDLLQMNSLQLKEFLEKELAENPMYELEMSSSFSFSMQEEFDIIDQSISLRDELLFQIKNRYVNLALLETILHNCDRNGYLLVDDATLAKQMHVSVQEVQQCINDIHDCEPYGLVARNLSECLSLQLQHIHPNESLALSLVKNDLEDIAKNHLDKLAKKYCVQQTDIRKAIVLIQSLNPRPASEYDLENTVFVKPDVILQNNDGEIEIVMPSYFNIKENEFYKGMSLDKDEKDFIKEKYNQGKMIVESIQKRKETLHIIAQVMVKKQQAYLLHKGPLQYLILKDIGELVSMHETTICRALKDKYYEYEGTIYPFKTLLCKKLNNTSVHEVYKMIKVLIEKEPKDVPYSDQKISNLLKEKGFICSRRTVAKYREDLHIPSAQSRKRLKEKAHE